MSLDKFRKKIVVRQVVSEELLIGICDRDFGMWRMEWGIFGLFFVFLIVSTLLGDILFAFAYRDWRGGILHDIL